MKNVVKLLSILFLVNGLIFTSCKKDPVKVTGVSLDKTAVTLEVNEDVTLTATVAPSDAEDKIVTWETNDDEVVTVDNNGKVTAKGVGKAKITVRTKDGGHTATCEVTVVYKIEDDYNVRVMAAFYKPDGSLNNTTGWLWIDLKGQEYKLSTVQTVSFKATIENISGKTIYQGTPLKYKFTANGKTVDVETMKEETIILETTIENDIPAGASMTLSPVIESGNFVLNPQVLPLGENEICVEVLQIGKKEASTPKKGCNDIQIDQ